MNTSLFFICLYTMMLALFTLLVFIVANHHKHQYHTSPPGRASGFILAGSLFWVLMSGCGKVEPSIPSAPTTDTIFPTHTRASTRTPLSSTDVAPTHTSTLSTIENVPDPTMTPLPPTATETLTPAALHTITPESVEAVDVVTSDGLPLAGWFYHPIGSPEKPIAVILAHQLNSSSWDWRTFAERLAQNGYPVLIFDFRGQGRSPGVLDFATVGTDMEAAIRFLKSHQYDRIVCIGASMGGSGCLAAAIRYDLAGLVNLSGPMNIPGTRLVTEEDLANLSIPKLFMIAEEDTIPDWPTFVSDFVEMVEKSPEPKALMIYPGQAHGTALLREDFGEEVGDRLLDFLKGLLPE